jgi:hypothetical protein
MSNSAVGLPSSLFPNIVYDSDYTTFEYLPEGDKLFSMSVEDVCEYGELYCQHIYMQDCITEIECGDVEQCDEFHLVSLKLKDEELQNRMK